MTCLLQTNLRGWNENDPPNKKFLIRGSVVDSRTNNPVEFANVVLKKSLDSSIVTGTYSGKTGEFILVNVDEGEYTLKVSYIGYTTAELPGVKIEGTANEINVGPLKIEQSAIPVEGVTVKGERASEEYHLDKKVINVSQSMHAAGGTALDVLQNQPSIRVDADGTVTLRGSSNFTVLVNGRPGVFQGADALKQIPANIIENIELITNPSAKYEAEGSAGIININTKVQTASSVNGIFNLGAGSKNKYNGDGTVNYTAGPAILTGGLDYRRTTFYQIQNVDRNSQVPIGEMTNRSDLDRIDTRTQYTIRFGIDYTFDENNFLSLSGNGGEVSLGRNMSINIHNLSPLSDDYVRTENTLDMKAKFFNSVLFYRYRIAPTGNEITAEASYTNVGMPYNQDTDEYLSDPTFTSRLPDPLSHKMINDVKRNEGRVKLNYTRAINPQSTFECGVQTNFSYKKLSIDNLIYDNAGEDWLIDSSLTNKYDFRNNVYAGFVIYSNVLYDFNFQLGLRAEHMDRLLEQKTMGSDYAYDKLDFFPTFSMSRKIDEHQLQFSYSRRVDRPNEIFLNPFPYYTDSYLTSAGNPKLLPEYTNSFELNYQKMFSGVFFSAQTYLRLSTNSLLQLQSADTNGKLIAQFGNFAKTATAGAEISSSFSPLPWLRLDPNINLYNYSMNGSVLDETIKSDWFTWTSRLTSTITVTPNTRLQVTGIYQGKQIFPQGDVKPVFILNVSAKQDFLGKKFSLTLQGQNLLQTSNFDVATQGHNFRNSFIVKSEVPVINLLLSYNFNNFKKSDRPTDRVEVNDGM